MFFRSRYAVIIVCVGLAIIAWIALRVPRNQHFDGAKAPPMPLRPAAAASRPPVIDQRATAATSSRQSGATINWTKNYYSAKDAFDFVSEAARKALAGDSAAAYYVALAVRECAGRANDPWNSADPESAFDAKWASNPTQTYAMAVDRKVMHDCLRFVRGDAFAGLPSRPGGYDSSDFWMRIAYDGGNPLAEADHAATMLNKATSGDMKARETSLATAHQDIQRALLSNDPAAVFQVGSTLDNPQFGAPPNSAIVFMLAACQLGFDCSAANPALYGIFACASIGTCAPGIDVQTWIRSNLGSSLYAATYSKAQQLADAVSAGDTASLQPFIQFQNGASNASP